MLRINFDTALGDVDSADAIRSAGLRIGRSQLRGDRRQLLVNNLLELAEGHCGQGAERDWRVDWKQRARAQIENPGNRIDEGGRRKRGPSIAWGADRSRFAVFVIPRSRVPVDAAASANDCFAALPRTPRNPDGGLEFLPVVRRRPEIIRPQNGSQELRLREVGVVVSHLRVPRDPVVHCQIRPQLPRVLNIRPVLRVRHVFLAQVRRRRVGTPDPDAAENAAAQVEDRKIQNVGVGSDRGGQIRKEKSKPQPPNELRSVNSGTKWRAESPLPFVNRPVDISPKTDTVRALLPAQAVIDFVPARIAGLWRIEVRADRWKIGAYHCENAGQSHSDAGRHTVRANRLQVVVAPDLILHAQIIYHRGAQDAGQSHDVLVGPVLVPNPVRRVAEREDLAESVVSIMRVARKHRVPCTDVVIKFGCELLAVIGAAEDASQWRERRHITLHADRLNLRHVLEIDKEEQLVFLDRTADVDTGVAPRKKRVWI